jgi:hypothetical protein
MYELLHQFLIIARYENDVLLENFFANKKLPEDMMNKFMQDAVSSGNSDEFFNSYGCIIN